MGPGAGEHGGAYRGAGHAAGSRRANPASLTGQYLSGRRTIALPQRAHAPDDRSRLLQLAGASGNNLKQVDLDLPVGLFVCVTGVSGSGKSTLINDTLYAAVARHLYGSADRARALRRDRRARATSTRW